MILPSETLLGPEMGIPGRPPNGNENSVIELTPKRG